MILVLASVIAVFLAGSTCGVFAVLVIGIHAEEQRGARGRAGSSRAGIASRRLLRTRTGEDVPHRAPARQ